MWHIFISANCRLVKEQLVFRQIDTHLQYRSAKCHEWFFPSVSGGYRELAGWPLTLDDVHCNLNVARVSQSQRLLQAAFAYHMNSAVLLWLLCKKKSEASHSVSFYQMYNILHHSLTCSKQLLFGIWYVPVVFKMINYGIPNTWGWRDFYCWLCWNEKQREREREIWNRFSRYFLLYLCCHGNMVRFLHPPRANVIVVCFSKLESTFSISHSHGCSTHRNHTYSLKCNLNGVSTINGSVFF